MGFCSGKESGGLTSPVVWGGEMWRPGYLQITHSVEAVVTIEAFFFFFFF